jgi:hypothetical protein
MSLLNGVRPVRADSLGHTVFPWRRLGKIIVGVLLIAAGGVTVHQQLIVRASREAVINARVSVIRAPIDGIARRAFAAPGEAIEAGATVGEVEDTQADDARAFQLDADLEAIARERGALSYRLADLRRAREHSALPARHATRSSENCSPGATASATRGSESPAS